ncbi:GNAT family N-acetyltransferase [Allorhizobium undicola]|uniref:GNAT family N-acetyltransferase n=1 Tax=Allorhizobium undicola TaxID=78527 RepID=UPI00055F73B1|nr:GNAT family N-acetyltransferase [Allorhizobium undicola]
MSNHKQDRGVAGISGIVMEKPVRSGDPHILCVRAVSSMEPLEREWRRLQRDPLNSLHQGYDWCRAWVKTHGSKLAILHGKYGDETAFILPLEVHRLHGIRQAQFIGARFSNINTGLLSARFRESGGRVGNLSELLTTALKDEADLLALANIPFDWRGIRHPFCGLPAIEHQNRSFQLPLGATMAETIAPLNAKRRRKKYRNQLRKIETAGGFEHIVARQEQEKAALLECFFRQKALRFQAQGLPDVFQPPETQAFFHLLLQGSSSGYDVPLELHAIRLAGKEHGNIAAIAGLSRKGDHVICQFGSIDESLVPEASPGELLFWLVIEQALDDGVALFDFGLGDQPYKRRWCSVETVQHDVVLPITAAGRLAALAYRGVTRSKSFIKSHPGLYRLIQRLRSKSETKMASDDD